MLSGSTSCGKSLKGFLIYFGIEPEFTHNISKLLNELEKYTEIPDNIKETIKLTNYVYKQGILLNMKKLQKKNMKIV
jgi:HEPN domain-containing protein